MPAVIYEGHYITNHHPVILTYFYGFFFWLGDKIGNVDWAVFGLSVIVLLISSFCMAYSINSIKKYISSWLLLGLLVFVCIYPFFGIYSYALCKDNLFADALLIFYTLLLEVVFSKGVMLENRKFKLGLTFIVILIPFLKNQGILVVVISLIVFAIVSPKFRKVFIFDMGLTILICISIY